MATESENRNGPRIESASRVAKAYCGEHGIQPNLHRDCYDAAIGCLDLASEVKSLKVALAICDKTEIDRLGDEIARLKAANADPLRAILDQVARGTILLHQLIADGKGDDSEADAIRDSLDAPLASLSKIERERARMLSEDLYSLTDLKPKRELKV